MQFQDFVTHFMFCVKFVPSTYMSAQKAVPTYLDILKFGRKNRLCQLVTLINKSLISFQIVTSRIGSMVECKNTSESREYAVFKLQRFG